MRDWVEYACSLVYPFSAMLCASREKLLEMQDDAVFEDMPALGVLHVGVIPEIVVEIRHVPLLGLG